jgi:hypothetical protein
MIMRSVTGPGRAFREVVGELVEMKGVVGVIVGGYELRLLSDRLCSDSWSLSGIIRPMAGDSFNRLLTIILFLLSPFASPMWHDNVSVASREREIRLTEEWPIILSVEVGDNGSGQLGKREYGIIDIMVAGSATMPTGNRNFNTRKILTRKDKIKTKEKQPQATEMRQLMLYIQ